MSHPIEDLMNITMTNLKSMIDVNTIIGSQVETKNNSIIIPISKVCYTFASGGSEFKGETVNEYVKNEKEEEIQYRIPFGGGSGAGVSIKPVAFLVVMEDTVKLLPIDHDSTIDKLIDYIPDLVEKSSEAIKCMKDKNKSIKDLKTKIEESIRKDIDTSLGSEEESLKEETLDEMPE